MGQWFSSSFFRRGWGAVRGRRLRSIRESVFIDCLCGCLAFLAGWTFPYCASSYWCLLILRDENSQISWILTFALRIEGKWTAERQWACGAGWQDPPLWRMTRCHLRPGSLTTGPSRHSCFQHSLSSLTKMYRADHTRPGSRVAVIVICRVSILVINAHWRSCTKGTIHGQSHWPLVSGYPDRPTTCSVTSSQCLAVQSMVVCQLVWSTSTSSVPGSSAVCHHQLVWLAVTTEGTPPPQEHRCSCTNWVHWVSIHSH